MAFIDSMRAATLQMHSSHMLAAKAPPHAHAARPPHPPVTRHAFVQYLAAHRDVYRALQPFPVDLPRKFADDISSDLWAIQTDSLDATASSLYYSPYVRYLATLPRERLGCHWYNSVFAHVAGGGLVVARAAQPVLPPGFFERSNFYKPLPAEGVDALRTAFEAEAGTWTDAGRDLCLAETPVAFRHLGSITKLLYASSSDPSSPGKSNITLDM